MTDIKPYVTRIYHVGTMADRRTYRVDVSYHDGDEWGRGATYREDRIVTFNGPSGDYGPVVMISDLGYQTIVDGPSRYGPFGPEWVRNFYHPVNV